jgi:hypothetical protein
MCRTYILYHLCGHIAEHKLLPCTTSINSKIDFIIQSPPITHQSVSPSPATSRPASPTSNKSKSDTDTTYTTTTTVPNSISRYYQHQPQTCSDTPEEIHILPELCDQCFNHGMAGEYLNKNPWAKADVLLAWKTSILEGTIRGSQVLDGASIIGDEDMLGQSARKVENSGSDTARVGDLRTRFAALETRVKRLTLRKPAQTKGHDSAKIEETAQTLEPTESSTLETIQEEEAETMEFIAPPPVAQPAGSSEAETDATEASDPESDEAQGSDRSSDQCLSEGQSSHTSIPEAESPEKHNATEKNCADTGSSKNTSESQIQSSHTSESDAELPSNDTNSEKADDSECEDTETALPANDDGAEKTESDADKLADFENRWRILSERWEKRKATLW